MSVKINRKKGKGKTTVERSDSTVSEQEDTMQAVTDSQPLAQVEFGVGQTINRGNYESARIDVRISLPCKNTKKAIKKAFDQADKYCEERLIAALEELEDE